MPSNSNTDQLSLVKPNLQNQTQYKGIFRLSQRLDKKRLGLIVGVCRPTIVGFDIMLSSSLSWGEVIALSRSAEKTGGQEKMLYKNRAH